MKPEDNIPTASPPEDEIDVIALLKTLWKGRKTIIWCVAVFTAIGLFVAMTSPNVYTASTTMVAQGQSRSGGSGGLGGLAALAGINLNDMGSGSQDLSPSLYPDIVKSYPFQKEMIYIPLKWNSIDKPISLFEYSKKYSKPNALSIVKKYTIGLPGIVMSLPGVVKSLFTKGNGKNEPVEKVYDSLFPISPEERAVCDALSNTLILSFSKSGYLTLTATGPEPLMTAQLVDKAQKLLQAKITEVRIHKSQQNLAFIQERYNEKKQEFETAQERLASFRDRNLNMASNMAKTEEERLQSQYQLVFGVYSDLAKQLEGSKIKIKEDTPVFSIIQPVCVPMARTKPNKPMILVIWLVLGVIVGAGWVFGRQYFKEVQKKWASHEA